MRIALVEVRQAGSVRKTLQARAVVCHDVHGSWEEEAHVAVAVLALVSAGKVAEVLRGSFARDGSA